MLDFLEYEEQVGRFWHRLIAGQPSHPRFADAAVALDEVQGAVPVFFRGIGGDPALEVVAGTPRESGHRLRVLQRLGTVAERVDRPARTEERVLLPPVLDVMPTRELNRALYFWLAAFLAEAPPAPPRSTDPLRADLLVLHGARLASEGVCAAYPGLARTYAELRGAMLALRPKRRLPEVEEGVEQVVRALLGEGPPASDPARGFLEAIAGREPRLDSLAAPRRYRPLLPVPLWGEVRGDERRPAGELDADAADADAAKDARDRRHRPARKRRLDQAERKDPLALINKGELILLATDMVNINRPQEDEEDLDAARKAADDQDELTLSDEGKRAATRLRLDLDLAPTDAEAGASLGPQSQPEWHYRKRRYLEGHCAVRVEPAPEDGEVWQPDAAAKRRIRRVQRQFEALRPRREVQRRQLDGSELDTDAIVRERCDLLASGITTDRVYLTARQQARDLAALVLIDQSLSTDAWVGERRVIDVEKEALTVLASGLAALGDAFALYGFTSRTRRDVRISMIKAFERPLDASALARIAALRPGHYTRLGAAIRYAAGVLGERGERQRLLFVLTDGKPNDVDHYEGRYGVEDTRRAVLEARRNGLAVFAVTVDERAHDHLPYVFGRGGYALVGQVDRLPPALPAIYRQLTT